MNAETRGCELLDFSDPRVSAFIRG